jgi:putative transposase
MEEMPVCARHECARPGPHLQAIYGIDGSPDLISTITDAVLVANGRTGRWSRSTPSSFSIVCALRSATRERFATRRFILQLGVRADGTKEALGLCIEQTEGAKFWLRVMNELKNRGANDILIAVVDGLKGFPDAINAVFPLAQLQTFIIHLIKERKPVAAALKEEAETARQKLKDFDAGPWGQNYPAIAQSWRRVWSEVIPFFAFPETVRRIIYITDEIDISPRAIFFGRGRPRGEERSLGWKLRHVA